jgi:putative membrane protein
VLARLEHPVSEQEQDHSMSSFANGVACALAWFVVLMQAGFGALEMFAPRWVFERVFDNYFRTRENPVWYETEKLARNMGLYNWFLALGLLLSLAGCLGGPPTSRFFFLCVAVAGIFGLFSVGPSRAFIAQLVLGLAAFVLFLFRY